jgi:hypothetical protein
MATRLKAEDERILVWLAAAVTVIAAAALALPLTAIIWLLPN